MSLMENSPKIVDPNGATTQFDVEFRTVERLRWLPWIGPNYSQRPSDRRLLIVGESHYYRGNTHEERQVEREWYVNNPDATRSMVAQAWDSNTWRAIPKFLFQTTEIDDRRFWSDGAYYNFIQRPMDYNGGKIERPEWYEYEEGWRVFTDIVRIIQPSHSLFLGVFVQGTKDEFARLDLLNALIDRLGARATLKLIPDADHSFHVPKRYGRTDGEVMDEMLDAVAVWMDGICKK